MKKRSYKKFGLCQECKQTNTGNYWCQSCGAKHFQKLDKWNHNVDKFIQRSQLKAENNRKVLEWIEYDRVEDVEYLANGRFGTTYKAIWKDGYIERWDIKNNQWER